MELFIEWHPTVKWKEDMQEQLKESLAQSKYRGRTKKDWKKRNGKERDKNGIPEFVLFHYRKGFETGNERVQTTVIEMQCKKEDAAYLENLLVEKIEKLKSPFIQSGYYLSTSPRRMKEMSNVQNKYVNASRLI